MVSWCVPGWVRVAVGVSEVLRMGWLTSLMVAERGSGKLRVMGVMGVL